MFCLLALQELSIASGHFFDRSDILSFQFDSGFYIESCIVEGYSISKQNIMGACKFSAELMQAFSFFDSVLAELLFKLSTWILYSSKTNYWTWDRLGVEQMLRTQETFLSYQR